MQRVALTTRQAEPAFARLIDTALSKAASPGGKVGEVAWIRAFQTGVEESLESELRAQVRGAGGTDSVNVASALVHGTTFVVNVPKSGVMGGAELADLMIVGERFNADGVVVQRQAMLLQMKVGFSRHPSGFSSARQMALYGTWRTIQWKSQTLRALPGTHPRRLRHADRNVARFGLLPPVPGDGAAVCCEVARSLHLRTTDSVLLATAMAMPASLTMNVDATSGPGNGWPRVVDDVLDHAGIKTFMEQPRLHNVSVPADDPSLTLVILVRSGPEGVVD